MKAEATLHLTGYSIHLLMLALSLLYPLRPDRRAPLIRRSSRWSAALALFDLMLPVPGVLFAVGQRPSSAAAGSRALPRIAMLSVLGAGMMVNTTRAAWQAVTTRARRCSSGPRSSAARDGGEDWRRLRYQVAIDRIVVVELALAVLNAVSAWAAVRQGLWPIAIYAAIFAAGLTYVSTLTIAQSMRSALASRGRSEARASASRGG